MAAIPRLRANVRPVLLSYGFRPFFFLGSGYAALAMLLWLPQFFGEIAIPTAFAPRDWHVHEMLFGYVAAVIAGFLFTAIPNWTGRLPLQGGPLLMLVLAWAAGRIAVALSAWIGAVPAAAIDLAFLALMGLAAAREIIAGRNWRNLKVLVFVALLVAANATFHIESALTGGVTHATRFTIAVVVGLIMVIGGRVVPSFTRNWLARADARRLPAPFGRFDALALTVALAALAGWVSWPDHPITGTTLAIAALLHAARLARWAGDRAWADRLVFVLHVAYGFIPIGFALAAGAALAPSHVPMSAPAHAWSIGAMGLMTLAVMTRATLGHTGRALVATRGTQLVYALLLTAVIARLAAIAWPVEAFTLLHIAAFAWIGAFGGFMAIYAPMLLSPRRAVEPVC